MTDDTPPDSAPQAPVAAPESLNGSGPADHIMGGSGPDVARDVKLTLRAVEEVDTRLATVELELLIAAILLGLLTGWTMMLLRKAHK